MNVETCKQNCSRNALVSIPKKGMRASSRIRKQRIAIQQYFEDDDLEDPFADNSDVDSNYSFSVGRNRRRRKRKNSQNRRGGVNAGSDEIRTNDDNDTVEDLNTVRKVSQRITQSRRIGGLLFTQVPVPLKRTGGRSPVQRRSELSNGLIVPTNEMVVYNPNSIPNLNKNGVMRGKDGTRVGTDSHWYSLDKQFKVGKFLIYKRDKPLLNTTKLSLWRIDSKSMLQKFQAFTNVIEGDNDDKTGTIKFKAVKVYAGWSPLHTEEFVLVCVKMNRENTKDEIFTGECVVQIDKKDIDIDSDE